MWLFVPSSNHKHIHIDLQDNSTQYSISLYWKWDWLGRKGQSSFNLARTKSGMMMISCEQHTANGQCIYCQFLILSPFFYLLMLFVYKHHKNYSAQQNNICINTSNLFLATTTRQIIINIIIMDYREWECDMYVWELSLCS